VYVGDSHVAVTSQDGYFSMSLPYPAGGNPPVEGQEFVLQSVEPTNEVVPPVQGTFRTIPIPISRADRPPRPRLSSENLSDDD
jgi:hypothetical protein